MNRKLLCLILSLILLLSFAFSANAAEENNISSEFVRGVDVSSYISLKNSGVSYKDFDGNELDDDGFFELLKSNSINCIRIRIWNNPYDSNGNGYGGGNCDIENACQIGKLAARHKIKLLVDFHLSDFWADPARQRVPKEWSGFSMSQKEQAIYDYIYNSLSKLKKSGADIAMVQIGNEINSGMCGETDFADTALLLKSGFKAVGDIGKDILKVVHYTDPQKNIYEWIADNLNKQGVDYDVFASSYYSYWHGTAENFTTELKKVAEKYDKYVMCAETSYPFTTEDSDFYANNVSGYENTLKYSVNVEGQMQAVRDTFNALKAVGEKGIGVFYWEPAWIAVGTSSYEENYSLWQQYGSGWESSFAAEYCDDGAKWHGGSSWDNQALFDKSGNPLNSLKVFKEFADKIMGDMDGDGSLSVMDATTLQKHIVGLSILSAEQLELADVCKDDEINVLDATMIQKIVTGLE